MANKTDDKNVTAETAVDEKQDSEQDDAKQSQAQKNVKSDEAKNDESNQQEAKQDETYGQALPVNSAGEPVEVTPETHAYQVEAGWSELDKERAAEAGADKKESFVTNIEAFVKKLEGKGLQELMVLRGQALVAEADAKREITILRQRAANMASTAETDVEEEIIQAKKELANALNWLQAVEKKIAGRV